MLTRTVVPFLAIGALAIAAVGPAPVQAQPAKCATVQFGEAVLSRFPRIREVCQDVVMKDGQEYAVVKGDLLRISSKTARIRPKLPGGGTAEARDLPIAQGRKVMVAGKAVAPADIAVGQELTFYVKVTEPVVATEPEASMPLEPMPLPEPAPMAAAPAPEMPKTAGPLPLIGLGGLGLLALGGALGLVRRRRS